MNYDFIIYGGGISSEIAALALAKNNFNVCYVKNQTAQKTKSNLVTFLSCGSINYLCSIIDDPLEFNKFTDIEKISCRLASIKDCLLYTSPSPRDGLLSRMPSSA